MEPLALRVLKEHSSRLPASSHVQFVRATLHVQLPCLLVTLDLCSTLPLTDVLRAHWEGSNHYQEMFNAPHVLPMRFALQEVFYSHAMLDTQSLLMKLLVLLVRQELGNQVLVTLLVKDVLITQTVQLVVPISHANLVTL